MLTEKQASGSRRPVTAVSIDQVVKNITEKRNEAFMDPAKAEIASQAKTLSVIIKADVNGSLEAILNVMETYNAHEKVRLDLAHFEVGPIKKSDIDLAELFNATIYVFNLPVNAALESEPTKGPHERKCKIKHFNVIYKMFDDLKSEINELAPLVDQEELLGEATVLNVFSYGESNTKTITVAGGRCLEGQIDRKGFYRLVRNGQVIENKLTCKSLKHLKTDVNTIKRNIEFGLAFEEQSVQPVKGDTIICYNVKKVKEPIEWNLGF
jgi:translation initiation factor IF-2